MSFEDQIQQIVREEVRRSVEPLQRCVETLLACVLVQQKNAAGIADVSPRTIASKIAAGEIEVHSRDGERRQFISLAALNDLKPRRK